MAGRAASHPRVVVVGAGFGGIEVAKALGKAGIGTTVIDRRNHHLFQPLLYQVATAALSAVDVAEPIRRICRRYKSVQVLFGEVVGIDTEARSVRLSDGVDVPYDLLVLAAGAHTSYFGHAEWESRAPGLKSLDDARGIRSQLLRAFERAERATDPDEQARLMTIAIVGGGPTGVELAGALAELSRFTLVRDFRNIRPETTRIHLIEGGPRLLTGFSEDLAAYARRRLERRGVVVTTGEMVEQIDDDGLALAGRHLRAGLVLWAAGVSASPLGRELGVETDKVGRLTVGPTLEVEGCPGVYALGDMARVMDENGAPLPGLAQVAKQEGVYLGRALARRSKDAVEPGPFVYRSRGDTAIVGRHAGVYEYGRFKLTGWFAWLLWAVVHVYLLVGFEHRVLVSIQWLWRYVTYEHGARVIAGDENEGEASRDRGRRDETG